MTQDIPYDAIDRLSATKDSRDFTRVKALLEYWADNRGTVRSVLLGHMQPRCVLHHLVKATRQRGELWAHNDAPGPIDDKLVGEIDEILARLPEPHRRSVVVTYTDGRHWTADKRAKKLGVGRTTYYRHLTAAYQAIDDGIDWRNVLVC